MGNLRSLIAYAVKSLILIIFVISLTSCAQTFNRSSPSLKDRTVSIVGKTFSVEIADTEDLRVKGLSGHPPLKDDQGMLFVFEDEQTRYFWMKDMLFPLDIVFIDSNGVIVDIKRDFTPCIPKSCPGYESAAPARYVLEVNAGLMEGIGIGKKAELPKGMVY